MSESTHKRIPLGRRIAIAPFRFYKKHISPALPDSCLYHPSCSVYMMEAIEKHGVTKGLILGTSRILRCNRLFLGGWDSVPDDFSWGSITFGWKAYRKPKGFSTSAQEQETTDPDSTHE